MRNFSFSANLRLSVLAWVNEDLFVFDLHRVILREVVEIPCEVEHRRYPRREIACERGVPRYWFSLVAEAGRRIENAPAGRQDALRRSGVDVLALPAHKGRLDLRSMLQLLHSDRGISTILVEAGPGLLSSLLESGCVDEACVFIAPTLLGDDDAIPPLRGRAPDTIDGGLGMVLQQVHRRGEDVLLRYGLPTGNS